MAADPTRPGTVRGDLLAGAAAGLVGAGRAPARLGLEGAPRALPDDEGRDPVVVPRVTRAA